MSNVQPDALRSIAFFSGLSDSVFTSLSQRCHRKSYEEQELIIGHKDETFDVLFLLTGHARVNIYSAAGRRISFRDISQGAIFGELSAIDGQARSASVECVEACSAVIMPRSAFIQALSEHPAFMLAVMKHLTGQVRNLTARVVEFSTLAVRSRVQAELLRIAGVVPAGINEAILSPAPTHAEIASRISTHREAVTRELSWLEEQDIISKEGRILRIKNLAKLRKFVDELSDA